MAPEMCVQAMLERLFQEADVLHCISVPKGPHAGQLEGVVTNSLKVILQKLVEDLHVSLFLELYVVGQVLQDLHNTHNTLKVGLPTKYITAMR